MKIVLAILGILFLLLAMSSLIVAAVLAFAPVCACLLFIVLGVALMVFALDMDAKNEPPANPPGLN